MLWRKTCVVVVLAFAVHTAESAADDWLVDWAGSQPTLTVHWVAWTL